MRTRLEELQAELNETRFRLEEATDTIEAIRLGEVDALVVKNEEGHQLYTLKSVDRSYRIFIEQMNEGAMTLDPGGSILYCNSRFAELIGYPLEKVFGQLLQRFVSGGSREVCKALIAEAWTSNIQGELNLVTATGTEVPVLLSLKTLNLDGELSLSIIITDLSRHKESQKQLLEKNAQLEQAQLIAQDLNANLEYTVKARTHELEKTVREKIAIAEELRRNQEQLSRILETMAEGVSIMNIDGKLTYANPMAREILGLKQDQNIEGGFVPQWSNYFRVDGSPLPEAEHPMMIAMTTGQPVYDAEIGIQLAGQELSYVSINAAPLHQEHEAVVAVIGTFMDVTHRRKAMQQKDDFIIVASHELKTPITSLQASVQLLNHIKHDPMNAMVPVLIEKANRSMNKVTNLLEDLLNTGKYTQGQLHLNKTRFVLSRLIEDNFRDIHSDGRFDILVEGERELEVYGDPDRLEQVVTNFVNNAMKYASASKAIRIRIEKTEHSSKLSVIDNGPGIPSDKLPHIFERYYRVDGHGKQYSGLGLGLYICSEIIKKHGGEIGVESKAGVGSTFWFTLPN